MEILAFFIVYIIGIVCCILLPTRWFRNKDAHLVFTFIWPLVVPFLPPIGIVALVDNILKKRHDK